VIRCGWGLERNRNGGSAVAAVLALPAVGGKFGVRGGGYTMSNSSALPLKPTVGARASDAAVNMSRAGRALLELARRSACSSSTTPTP
jgi:anaerobic selenocysteine-containing dehydrogenase